jgi:hypothetical protein
MERVQWPIPDDETLSKQIMSGDKHTFNKRLERYKFIRKEFGPPSDMLLVGGFPSMFAIEELQFSYINALYMATILLSQSFIEHSLGGSFLMSGDDDIVEKGFSKLIDKALETNQIDQKLAGRLHELRKMRNPYTHPKPGITKRSYMGRMKEKDIYDPEILAEQDARFAIQIVIDFLRHGSKHWDPNNKNFHY